jgi:hypothetical protein
MPNEREQEVRERAYAIWEQEGQPDGHSLDHWLRAKAEVITEEALGIRHEGELESPSPTGPGDTELT